MATFYSLLFTPLDKTLAVKVRQTPTAKNWECWRENRNEKCRNIALLLRCVLKLLILYWTHYYSE